MTDTDKRRNIVVGLDIGTTKISLMVGKMNEYKNKAISILDNYPESEYKSSLLKMIDYVVQRKI